MREIKLLLLGIILVLALTCGYLLIPPEVTVQYRTLHPFKTMDRDSLSRREIVQDRATVRNLFHVPAPVTPLRPPGTVEVHMIKPVKPVPPVVPVAAVRNARLELLGWQVQPADGAELAFLWDGEKIHFVRTGDSFLEERYRLEAVRTNAVILYDNLRHRKEEVTQRP